MLVTEAQCHRFSTTFQSLGARAVRRSLGKKWFPEDSAVPWQEIICFKMFLELNLPLYSQCHYQLPLKQLSPLLWIAFHCNSCSFSYLCYFLFALYPVHLVLPTQNSVPIMSLPGSDTDCISSPSLLSLQLLPFSAGLFSLLYKDVPILSHLKQNKIKQKIKNKSQKKTPWIVHLTLVIIFASSTFLRSFKKKYCLLTAFCFCPLLKLLL